MWAIGNGQRPGSAPKAAAVSSSEGTADGINPVLTITLVNSLSAPRYEQINQARLVPWAAGGAA